MDSIACARRARPPELFEPQERQGSMVPLTEPVYKIVMLLLPSAKEATGEKMPNKKDKDNRKKNRFI